MQSSEHAGITIDCVSDSAGRPARDADLARGVVWRNFDRLPRISVVETRSSVPILASSYVWAVNFLIIAGFVGREDGR